MDVDQLIAFQCIVREGSFTRAALSLGIGQPAVSARIHALEQELGGALFSRGRRIALTALGESFLPYVQRATELLAQGVEAGRLARTGQRGRVTLASLGSLAAGLVAPAMAKVAADHPNLEWFVRSGDYEKVLRMLLDGLVELGIVVWPCPEPGAADLTRLFVVREPIVLAVAPTHPLATRRHVTRDAVVQLGRPFLRLRWWREHHPDVDVLARRAKSSLELPMETARYLVIRGAATGYFPRTYIAEDLLAERLVAVDVRDQAPLTRTIALVRGRRPAPPAPAIAATIAALREQARALGSLR
jgi:LysR family transcriptional regulator, low CO2-responsive transcriptional regulator